MKKTHDASGSPLAVAPTAELGLDEARPSQMAMGVKFKQWMQRAWDDDRRGYLWNITSINEKMLMFKAFRMGYSHTRIDEPVRLMCPQCSRELNELTSMIGAGFVRTGPNGQGNAPGQAA